MKTSHRNLDDSFPPFPVSAYLFLVSSHYLPPLLCCCFIIVMRSRPSQPAMGQISTSTKQTAPVCSLRHARNVFAPVSSSSTSCTVCVVSGWILISTMNIKRRKAQFPGFCSSVFNEHRQRHAFRKPSSRPRALRLKFRHHHIHTELSYTIHTLSPRAVFASTQTPDQRHQTDN